MARLARRYVDTMFSLPTVVGALEGCGFRLLATQCLHYSTEAGRHQEHITFLRHLAVIGRVLHLTSTVPS